MAITIIVTSAGACGGGGDSASGPGTYVWEAPGGGRVTYYVPTRPDENDEIQDIEGFRERVGATRPVTYVVAAVDNADGDEEVEVPPLAIVTPDGETVKVEEVWVLIGEWQNMAATDSLYNRGVGLYNNFLDRGTVLPGATSSVVLATRDPVDGISRVFAETETGSEQLDHA